MAANSSGIASSPWVWPRWGTRRAVQASRASAAVWLLRRREHIPNRIDHIDTRWSHCALDPLRTVGNHCHAAQPSQRRLPYRIQCERQCNDIFCFYVLPRKSPGSLSCSGRYPLSKYINGESELANESKFLC